MFNRCFFQPAFHRELKQLLTELLTDFLRNQFPSRLKPMSALTALFNWNIIGSQPGHLTGPVKKGHFQPKFNQRFHQPGNEGEGRALVVLEGLEQVSVWRFFGPGCEQAGGALRSL